MKYQTCTACGVAKPIKTSFRMTTARGKRYRRKQCNECMVRYYKEYRRKLVPGLLSQVY